MNNSNSWVSIDPSSDFSIHNLPFGIFSIGTGPKRIGIAIGTQVVDLKAAALQGCFENILIDDFCLESDFLNDFIAKGKQVTNAVRTTIQKELCNENSTLRNDGCLLDSREVEMHLPVRIGDYTDFYSSIEHATNVGTMFRDPANALMPNWKHIPVGYHGRASSIIISGKDVHRPMGQINPDGANPIYSATRALDFELEMAFIVGSETQVGETISVEKAEDSIFGMVIFNDWSARDVQKWEYVPLGPFLAKNFASSISPWVVTLEAMDDFRVSGPKQDPEVLPYLKFDGDRNLDIKLEVGIKPMGEKETVVSKSNFKYMYWNMAQQLAHHTMNGCNIKVGDMMASGTISGKDESSYGSMLEIAWQGTKPVTLADGTDRKFIQDHDTVNMRAYCEKNGKRVGFGEVTTKILPAKK